VVGLRRKGTVADRCLLIPPPDPGATHSPVYRYPRIVDLQEWVLVDNGTAVDNATPRDLGPWRWRQDMVRAAKSEQCDTVLVKRVRGKRVSNSWPKINEEIS
jgi:hypothetical protein